LQPKQSALSNRVEASLLAQGYDAPIRLGCRAPIPETDDREADAVAAAAALQGQFEAFIREAPKQWMSAHRKWDWQSPEQPLPPPLRFAAGRRRPCAWRKIIATF